MLDGQQVAITQLTVRFKHAHGLVNCDLPMITSVDRIGSCMSVSMRKAKGFILREQLTIGFYHLSPARATKDHDTLSVDHRDLRMVLILVQVLDRPLSKDEADQHTVY